MPHVPQSLFLISFSDIGGRRPLLVGESIHVSDGKASEIDKVEI